VPIKSKSPATAIVGLFISITLAKIRKKTCMNDFITNLNGLLKMTADISMWRLAFLLLAVIVCIFAWQSPQFFKAYLEYKKYKGDIGE
jgi:hypothetical protein